MTLGKPLAGGAIPAGAVVLSRRIADQLDDQRWQTFSTFRGHPIMIAGMRAHIRVQQRDGLAQHARDLDGVLAKTLTETASRHPSVGRVDGRGTHWTIELQGPDWRDWYADVPDAPVAARAAAAALDAGALIGTIGGQLPRSKQEYMGPDLKDRPGRCADLHQGPATVWFEGVSQVLGEFTCTQAMALRGASGATFLSRE